MNGSVPRVVVTGLGAVSPVGANAPDSWAALVAGRSGVGPITRFDPVSLNLPVTIAGEARDADLEAAFSAKELKYKDLFTLFALLAAGEAIEDSGLEITPANAERLGTLIATGVGGMTTLSAALVRAETHGYNRMSPHLPATFIPNMAAGEVAMRFGLKGPSGAAATACSASANAIGEAADWIRLGRADAVVVGGSEASVLPMCLGAFSSARALSTRNEEPERASRPFDADRDGFVVAEGAAVVVLESLEHARARGARVRAEFLGYGMSTDAYHMTAPDPEGDGARRSMQLALDDAGRSTTDVDYVNAHGTATRMNDRTEALAIRNLFGAGGDSLPVSSTKSMTGHMLGAAGAFEAMVCVRAIEEGVIPPTINLETPDPECDLDFVPNKARRADVGMALSNSFAFGGHNVTLAFGRLE
jgi:3-oxoacyl-[acyl-carrier-protein] synthase II